MTQALDEQYKQNRIIYLDNLKILYNNNDENIQITINLLKKLGHLIIENNNFEEKESLYTNGLNYKKRKIPSSVTIKNNNIKLLKEEMDYIDDVNNTNVNLIKKNC